MKKILALLLALAMVFSLCACGSSEAPAEEAPAEDSAAEEAPAEEAPAAEGSVYYLNFKPEQDAQWQELSVQWLHRTFGSLTFTDKSTSRMSQYLAQMGLSLDKNPTA